ncbi:MAG: hypothetical protein HQL25_04125 [Candidatus Omnitrophica bacterium]|nr:hypothetical protein [Candidatus Omnitrophota bacterium]
MTTQIKKLVLEIYGLCRMILGVAQLTALSSGYFFWEFIARKPESGMYVVPQETVLLLGLAIFVRSVWHIAVGIGVARIQRWAKYWLFAGWPLMFLVTYGIVYALWLDQGELGKQAGLISTLIWWKICILIFWMVIDWFLISKFITDVEANISEGKLQGRIEISKITAAFLGALVFILILLFAARPLRSGFHQGFYKASGDKSVAATTSVAESPSLSEDAAAKEAKSLPKPKSGVVIKPAEAKVNSEQQKVVDNSLHDKTVSEKSLVGYVAGLCVIIGIFLWLYLASGLAEFGMSAILPLLMTSFGFLLWAIYGFSQNLFAVGIMNVLAFIASLVVVVFVRMKS